MADSLILASSNHREPEENNVLRLLHVIATYCFRDNVTDVTNDIVLANTSSAPEQVYVAVRGSVSAGMDRFFGSVEPISSDHLVDCSQQRKALQGILTELYKTQGVIAGEDKVTIPPRIGTMGYERDRTIEAKIMGEGEIGIEDLDPFLLTRKPFSLFRIGAVPGNSTLAFRVFYRHVRVGEEKEEFDSEIRGVAASLDRIKYSDIPEFDPGGFYSGTFARFIAGKVLPQMGHDIVVPKYTSLSDPVRVESYTAQACSFFSGGTNPGNAQIAHWYATQSPDFVLNLEPKGREVLVDR